MVTVNLTGAELIVIERQHQIDKGWTASHDDGHEDGELAVVAGMLALAETDARVVDGAGHEWDDYWGLVLKHRGDRLRQLVIAGALIAAEIDRIKRENERD